MEAKPTHSMRCSWRRSPTQYATWRRRPTQCATWRRSPTQYAVIMEAHDQIVSRWRCIEPAIVPEHSQIVSRWRTSNRRLYRRTSNRRLYRNNALHSFALHNMDQVEELRGCDQRHTACMLNRLGDLQRPAGFTTRAFDEGALATAAVPKDLALTCRRSDHSSRNVC